MVQMMMRQVNVIPISEGCNACIEPAYIDERFEYILLTDQEEGRGDNCSNPGNYCPDRQIIQSVKIT